jgi:sirohydrochlorin cobaltochelatase
MPPDPLTNDALLLISHGSARYADAGRALQAHAAVLRNCRLFAEVGVGFLAGAPSISDALASLSTPTVHVVPFFMEDGYFTRVAVPSALAPAGGQQIRYHPAVGTHSTIPGLIERCGLERCAALGLAPERLRLLLVGHGSSRAPGRITALHGHVTTLTQASRFADAHIAFLEEAPLVATALARLRPDPVGVLGFFAGEGGHVRDDPPALIAAERTARAAAGAAGDHAVEVFDFGTVAGSPDMPGIIMDLVATDH